MKNLEVGDLVLCTVDRIIGTVVFVKIPIGNNEIEGSIIMSEIAPGRIRNLRDYVVPKKKIVCKVLRISAQGNIELSLRRVSQKEKKEVLEQDKQEKSYASVLKSVIGEKKAEEVLKKIAEQEEIISFFETVKINPEKLEKIIGKENAKKIIDILKTQKSKKKKIKKEIRLTTTQSNGIILIKKILGIFKDMNIKYISAGKYSLETEAKDVKTADKKMHELIDIAEKEAKKIGVNFSGVK